MKVRQSFVTNSSSTSYIITNTSDETKTLVDFVRENPQLIEQFVEQYDWHREDSDYTQEKLLESAEQEDQTFAPHESEHCTFGDEHGTIIGNVFDYILRDGGRSASFTWEFYEFNR